MKAAVYDNPGPPTVLRYADVPDPMAGPNDVLIAVKAISIEGGDLINRRKTQQPSPWIVGYAAAGTILSIGENVRGRAVGQRVTVFDMQGSHAELWSVPACHTHVAGSRWCGHGAGCRAANFLRNGVPLPVQARPPA